MRTVLTNESLEKTLSRDRLQKYLDDSSQDLDAAIELYEQNTRLSEAFYTPLQCLEICLRNSIHLQLSNVFGEDWFRNGKPELVQDSKFMIFDAIEELKKDRRSILTGRIVAELKFAFWVGLLGPKYDSTLWRQGIYKAFSAQGARQRSGVHSRLNAIRRLRNRIAHHEPIFNRPLVRMHNEILESIGWMCRDTAAWAKHHSRFVEVAKGCDCIE